jgi:hypothetical protein
MEDLQDPYVKRIAELEQQVRQLLNIVEELAKRPQTVTYPVYPVYPIYPVYPSVYPIGVSTVANGSVTISSYTTTSCGCSAPDFK